MRTTITFAILLIFISCQQNEQGFREEIESDSLYAYDENNILRLKGPLEHGLKNGEFHLFDSAGNIKSIAHYVKDTLNGKYKEYYLSGIVKSASNYVYGKPYGEELVFYDDYQDSMAIKIDGQWKIAPYSTKLKQYNYRDLRGKITYQRIYDEDGQLISKRGRLFLAKFYDSIIATTDKQFTQAWLTPAPSGTDLIDVKQHFVIYGPNTRDTIYINSDSLVARWTKTLSKAETYEYQAVAYLLEGDKIETDTSKFTVKIDER